MKTVLTIAGSDPSGGAGLQADLKTITAHGLYGMSAITALTAQNTTGVYGIMPCPPAFLAQQLDCIFQDIPPDAVKIGMAGGVDQIQVIAQKLGQFHAQRVVLDPVMVATSGGRLLANEAVQAVVELLLPLCTLITPNIPEAEVLAEMSITNAQDMERAAAVIGQRGPAVLIKGGHRTEDANDLLWEKNHAVWFKGERIATENTHGTGCTLSSAIACRLAQGDSLEESVRRAKGYLTGALGAGLNLGKGSGPIDHTFQINQTFCKKSMEEKR